MSGTWPKIIRDPVHDIVTFEDSRGDRLLLDLINTREFQRLRRIKQLGMSELVFPGANHSRFAHSIGVLHNARRFLNRLDKVASGIITEAQRTAVLVAALLHDLGHGPFSHTFEKITDEDHEARTLEVIIDPSTEINRKLTAFDPKLPGLLGTFFDEDMDSERRESAIPPYLTQVVTGQLDADRFDYLQRDSHATGTNYGRFDDSWLIEHLLLDGDRMRIFLSHKSLMAAEAYVFARFHMYRTVYFHKTTRSAEVMLRLIFKRFKERLAQLKGKKRDALAPGAPPAIVAAFSGPMSLDGYLSLDDHAVSEFLKACRNSSDQTLQMLASGLIDRKLYKAVEASSAQGGDVGKFTAAAFDELSRQKLDPAYFLVDDSPGDLPYAPYDPDQQEPATQIYVQTTLGQIQEISTLSEPIEKLKKRYTLLRYYFPESIRPNMDEIANATLNKGRKS